MFTNIAGKLKGLAIIQTIIFIAFGIIIWTLPFQTGGFVPKSEAGLFVIIGIIIMLAGGDWPMASVCVWSTCRKYRSDKSKFGSIISYANETSFFRSSRKDIRWP